MKTIHSRHHARHATTLDLPGSPIPCFELPGERRPSFRRFATLPWAR